MGAPNSGPKVTKSSKQVTKAKEDPGEGSSSGPSNAKPPAKSNPTSASVAQPGEPWKPRGMKSLPRKTSFLFYVGFIKPKAEYANQDTDSNGQWIPPTRWDAYEPGKIFTPKNIWRWTDGIVTHEDNEKTRLHSHPDTNKFIYRSSTVFWRQSTGRFLAHLHDIRIRTEAEEKKKLPAKWYDIGITHTRACKSKRCYNDVQFPGHNDTFCERITSSWKQLFPQSYNPPKPPIADEGHSDSTEGNAGLVGDRSAIFALIALYCGPNGLKNALLDHVRLGTWIELEHAPDWRQDRGVVVCVWQDPARGGNDLATLKALENGDFGPFFGP